MPASVSAGSTAKGPDAAPDTAADDDGGSRRLSLLTLSLLALVLGVVTGLGAVIFRDLIGLLHNVFFNGTFAVAYDGAPAATGLLDSDILGSADFEAFLGKPAEVYRVDGRTGWVLSLCALDNLVKGASGQALQCANVALGLPEATGLPRAGLFP